MKDYHAVRTNLVLNSMEPMHKFRLLMKIPCSQLVLQPSDNLMYLSRAYKPLTYKPMPLLLRQAHRILRQILLRILSSLFLAAVQAIEEG